MKATRIQQLDSAAVRARLRGRIPAELMAGVMAMGGISVGYADEHRDREIARMVQRSKNPTFAGVQDAIDQPIYDSFTVAQGAAFPNTTLYQSQVGSGGKTKAQTNMQQSGTLPTPQRLLLKAIYMVIANNTTPTDVINIHSNVSFQLNVGTKNYLTCPAGFLTAGRGLIVNAVANVGTVPAGSAPVYSTSSGIQDPRAIFALDNQWFIESGESFQVILYPETAFNMQANTTKPAGVGPTIYV